MPSDHPTREVLERFRLGRLPAAAMRSVSRHLLTGCAECRRIAKAGRQPAEPAETSYDAAIDRVFARVADRETAVARERDLARELYQELLQHPEARRRLLVSNSARFRSRMLCEVLLAESHQAGFEEPARAVELARLAVAAAGVLTEEACGGAEGQRSLAARAWAQLGNALRVTGDHPEAERAFAAVDALVAQGGLALLDTARVLDLKASLCRDQRRFAEASRLLDRVVAIYQQLGQWHLLGRALKQKSMVCGEAGDLEGEMALLRRALDLLDPDEEPRTFLAARHNLIAALNQSGRSREAFALLFHTRPLYLQQGDRMNLLRLRWLEGMVAGGLGRLEQAEIAYREVRDAFLELGLDYDAALASLDLAGVLARQGRSADVRRLAAETLAVFAVRDIHREAFAALAFFSQAAQREVAQVSLVQEVVDFLKRVRNNPDLRFRPPA